MICSFFFPQEPGETKKKGGFICLCWAWYYDGEGMISKKGFGVAERLYSAPAFWFFPSFVQD